MKLLIAIINYRTGKLVADCLRSLAGELMGSHDVRVIIADNASADGSIDQIDHLIETAGWNAWASTLPLPHNGGFAYGNNAVIRAGDATGDAPAYVLLLNPDTVPRPGAIRALLAFMDAHPRVGIAGSRLENVDGTPQRSAFRFPTVQGELDNGLKLGPVSRLLARWVIAPAVPSAPCRCDWVSGASLIIRAEVLEQVGLLDEGFFMYFEETDFCRRAARAGWPCWYVPASRVVHLVGQSSGVNARDGERARLPSYWFDSRRRYFVRNHGIGYAVMVDLAWVCGHLVSRLRRFVQRKQSNEPAHILRDVIRHNVLFRAWFGSTSITGRPA